MYRQPENCRQVSDQDNHRLQRLLGGTQAELLWPHGGSDRLRPALLLPPQARALALIPHLGKHA